MATGKSASVSFSVILACVSMAMVSACGKDDGGSKSGNGAPIAPFLKESDFEASKPVDVSQTDLQGTDDSSVNALEDLGRSLASSDSNTGNAFVECIFGEAKYSVSKKSTVTIAAIVDGARCKQIVVDALGIGTPKKFTKFTIKIFSQLTCDGADLSAVNGKKLTEAGDIQKIVDDQCAKSTQILSLSNSETVSEATDTVDGKPVSEGSVETSAQMKADGTPCIKTKTDNLWTWTDGCGFYKKNLTTAADTSPDLAGTALVTMVKFLGVKEVTDTTSLYYSEGKASIDINGWKGEAVFVGPTQAPSWSLKKGDVTATGVYAPAAAKE
jgi:hypothetical protein